MLEKFINKNVTWEDITTLEAWEGNIYKISHRAFKGNDWAAAHNII